MLENIPPQVTEALNQINGHLARQDEHLARQDAGMVEQKAVLISIDKFIRGGIDSGTPGVRQVLDEHEKRIDALETTNTVRQSRTFSWMTLIVASAIGIAGTLGGTLMMHFLK